MSKRELKDNKKFKRIENLYLGPEARLRMRIFLLKKLKENIKKNIKF